MLRDGAAEPGSSGGSYFWIRTLLSSSPDFTLRATSELNVRDSVLGLTSDLHGRTRNRPLAPKGHQRTRGSSAGTAQCARARAESAPPSKWLCLYMVNGYQPRSGFSTDENS